MEISRQESQASIKKVEGLLKNDINSLREEIVDLRRNQSVNDSHKLPLKIQATRYSGVGKAELDAEGSNMRSTLERNLRHEIDPGGGIHADMKAISAIRHDRPFVRFLIADLRFKKIYGITTEEVD